MNGHARAVDAWIRAALAPPRAHGEPLPSAVFKAMPDDFRVEEELSFTPSGDGPHWLLQIEKRSANTRWVAAQLAQLAGVAAHDVGFAGLKDRHAVTVQWFSVPVRGASAEHWLGVQTGEFRVLDVRANARKLRRGALAGNRFSIRLRDVPWTGGQLESKLTALRAHGVPNYFGPQRFGRDGSNLDRVQAWIATGRAPRGRTERAFALSAARALLFNAVLARRVEAGDWSQLAAGDLASLEGSGSHFQVAEVDDDLLRRLSAFDVHPSGALWGRGLPASGGRALRHELDAAKEFEDVASLLGALGLSQERRSLRCTVRELSVRQQAGILELSFRLGRGQFATAVLREICDLGAAAELEPDDG